MLKNLLFTMSLSGSIVVCLYMLLYPFAKRYFSLKWKYNVLKIAITFYLIPFPELKYIIIGRIYYLLPNTWKDRILVEGMMKPEYMIIFGRNLLKISIKVKQMMLIMFIIAVFTLGFVLKRAIEYWKMSRLYFAYDKGAEDIQRKLFLTLKEELGIKKEIRFIRSEYCRSPMSGGIFSPAVIFPMWDNGELDSDALRNILKHELVHIKHHDLLVKLFGLIVIAAHWFNPLSYILFREISNISEMYCDSVVLQGKGDEERCKYGTLILELAQENNSSSEWQFFSGIAQRSTKNYYKRRILEMRANRRSKTILSMIMTGVICIAGAVTSFAYNPSNVVLNNTEYSISTNVSVIREETEQEWEDLPFDYYFIDENGDIVDLSNVDEEARVLCIHDFDNGRIVDHQENGKGGCTVKTYSAQVCKFCGFAKLGTLLSTVTYDPCPH